MSLSLLLVVLAGAGLVLAAIPAGLVLVNLCFYRAPRAHRENRTLPTVSVLIPARDEEARIGRTLDAVLASRGVDLDVLVMDDQSTDRTAEIVGRRVLRDGRVRLLAAPPLPAGWAGKQHACHALAEHANHEVLVFLDADVTLAPDGLARALDFLVRSRADLVSGFPHQRTRCFAERLVIPLMHFVLLGYLPFPGLRYTRNPGFAAGCGQLMVARRDAYQAIGGHGAIRETFHDGIRLPRAFRSAGRKTDLFDATSIASCRMYHDAREVVFGLAKNAHEGLGGPVAIWVWSVLLLGGQVLPPLMALGLLLAGSTGLAFQLAVGASASGLVTRLVLAARFRQSGLGAMLHPVGVAALVAIQWFARARRRAGQAVTWKDRAPATG